MHKRVNFLIFSILIIFAILPIINAESNFTYSNSTYIAGTGEAIVYSGLNGVLLLLLAGCFIIFLNFENLLSRVASFGVGYLFLIAISFVSWQMASDFVNSFFLIEIFRILFIVLVIGAFPLLIGSLVWYFLMLWKIKEIERLMEKGFSLNDAERRVKGRKK